MSFAKALNFTLMDLEGGYVLTDRPGDAGGPTYAGITERLAVAAGYQWHPPFDPVEVANIYRSQFWDTCRCSELPEPSDAVLFQCAVNIGQGEALKIDHEEVKIFQRAIGVTPDGDFGPKTLAAALSVARDTLPDLILEEQDAYYRMIGGSNVKGWLNRTEKVRKAIATGVL